MTTLRVGSDAGNPVPASTLFATAVVNGGQVTFWGAHNDFSFGLIICDNSWHHIAMSYSNPYVSAYVDGVQVYRKEVGRLATAAAPPVSIGATIWAGSFTGAISSARIFDRALSAGEIAADFGVC